MSAKVLHWEIKKAKVVPSVTFHNFRDFTEDHIAYLDISRLPELTVQFTKNETHPTLTLKQDFQAPRSSSFIFIYKPITFQTEFKQ